MSAQQPQTYSVEAYNLSHASENKIHDDEVARRLGFTGGLVPGVEVYAYACHPVVAHWGKAWLERGTIECRLLKPVYDGRIAQLRLQANGAGLSLEVESEGIQCAVVNAALDGAAAKPPSLTAYEVSAPPAERPPADETSLAPGRPLGIVPVTVDTVRLSDYLRDVREPDPIYRKEGIVHPGQLLRLCNSALKDNVVLAPWIHTGSKVRNFALARVGDELTVRGRVVANYERKGHRLVDLDILIVANSDTVVAHVQHTAVYRLRQLTADR